MLNIKINFFNIYKKLILKKKILKIYKKFKIISPLLNKKLYIYNGYFFVKRNFNFYFLNRTTKFNTLYKKPLSRPSKKKKK